MLLKNSTGLYKQTKTNWVVKGYVLSNYNDDDWKCFTHPHTSSKSNYKMLLQAN